VIVGLDLRKPKLSMNLVNEVGIVNYLIGQKELKTSSFLHSLFRCYTIGSHSAESFR
jgi:hypothetical protein